jgi:hypothetical protein
MGRFALLALAAALIVGCAAQPATPAADGSATSIASAAQASGNVVGLINLDRWRVPGNACLDYASAEGMVAGDAVEILGADAQPLGSSVLAATDPDDPQSCALSFQIDDVQPSESYTFVVAGRISRAFPHAELVDAGWEVDLSPDSDAYPEVIEDGSADVRLALSAPIPLELEGTATCRVLTDARYPDRGLTTISLVAASLGRSGGYEVSLNATLKLLPNWLSYAAIEVMLDGDLAYRASPDLLSGHGLDADARGGEVSVADVQFSGAGASLDGAAGVLAGTLEWSCGERIDADKALGQVSIGPPFEVDVEIAEGRCDPPSPDWQPMWLSFSAETAFGPMTGEINRMFPTLLDVQLDIPNLGEQRLLTSEFDWSGEATKVTAEGTRYEAAASLDLGLVGDVEMNDVAFEAWWLCPS